MTNTDLRTELVTGIGGGVAAAAGAVVLPGEAAKHPAVGLGVAAVGAVGMMTTRGAWRAGAAGVLGAGVGMAVLAWLEERKDREAGRGDKSAAGEGNEATKAPASRLRELWGRLVAWVTEPRPEAPMATEPYTGGAVHLDDDEDEDPGDADGARPAEAVTEPSAPVEA